MNPEAPKTHSLLAKSNTSVAEETLAPEEIPKEYRELLRKANLSPDELKELGRLKIGRPLIDFLWTIVLMIASPTLFALAPGFATGIICVLITLHNFNRLASLVHASDHGYLFTSLWANNLMGNLAAYLMGYTRAGHRLSHQLHHSQLNTEGDSDKVWGRPTDSSSSVAKKWLEDLFLISAIRRAMQYSQPDRKSYSVSPWERFNLIYLIKAVRVQAPVIPVQLALMSLYWLIAGFYYYLVFHFLVLITLYPVLIRIRSTAEHSFPAGYRPLGNQLSWVTRSTNANWFERFVVAPLDGHFHFEHHLFPGIPYYNLRQAHILLKTKGFSVPMAPGYLAYFFEKWKTEQQIVFTRQQNSVGGSDGGDR